MEIKIEQEYNIKLKLSQQELDILKSMIRIGNSNIKNSCSTTQEEKRVSREVSEAMKDIGTMGYYD